MDPTLQDQIDQQISSHRVLLFMKGTPAFPQCGFSNQCIQILRHVDGEFIGGCDIMVEMHNNGDMPALLKPE